MEIRWRSRSPLAAKVNDGGWVHGRQGPARSEGGGGERDRPGQSKHLQTTFDAFLEPPPPPPPSQPSRCVAASSRSGEAVPLPPWALLNPREFAKLPPQLRRAQTASDFSQAAAMHSTGALQSKVQWWAEEIARHEAYLLAEEKAAAAKVRNGLTTSDLQWVEAQFHGLITFKNGTKDSFTQAILGKWSDRKVATHVEELWKRLAETGAKLPRAKSDRAEALYELIAKVPR